MGSCTSVGEVLAEIIVANGAVLCAVPKNDPLGLKAQPHPALGGVGVLTVDQLEVLRTVRNGVLS